MLNDYARQAAISEFLDASYALREVAYAYHAGSAIYERTRMANARRALMEVDPPGRAARKYPSWCFAG